MTDKRIEEIREVVKHRQKFGITEGVDLEDTSFLLAAYDGKQKIIKDFKKVTIALQDICKGLEDKLATQARQIAELRQAVNEMIKTAAIVYKATEPGSNLMDVFGIDPDFTNGKSATDFLKKQRGESEADDEQT
jgi:hypothetical protein